VLNATAELNALGQLVITGDDAADTVQFEVNASEQLLLRDGVGNVIPIAGHPSNSTAPLFVSAITSNQLVVDLRGGDDIFFLQIPSSLNVVVIDGAGVDSSTLSFRSSSTLPTARTIDVASELIRIDEGAGSIDLRGIALNLSGTVHVGSSSAVSSLQFSQSSLDIDGALTIDGDVNFNGTNSTIDLANATLSASGTGSDLTISLDSFSDLTLGAANDSAGTRVNDVAIDSARTVSVQATQFEINGEMIATNVFGSVLFSGDIEAQSFLVEAQGGITVAGSLSATDGNIQLTSGSVIEIAGQLDSSTSINRFVALEAISIVLRNADTSTAGGDISLTGSVLVGGDLNLNTSANPSIFDAGRILIGGSIESLIAGEGVLNFNTEVNLQNSSIVISDSIGEVSRLRSATFRTSSLTVGGVNLDSGDLRIDALGTFAFGSLIAINGSIDVSGSFVLRNPNLAVEASEIIFQNAVTGSSGNESFNLVATESLVFKNRVGQFANLTVTAGDSISFDGPVTLSGNLVANGNNPTQVSSSTIQTTGIQQYNGGVSFLRDGVLIASEVSLGEQTLVANNVLYNVNSTVIGDSLRKIGAGTLVLNGESRIADETQIEAGAFRLNGIATARAGVVQVIGGRLEGSGVINGTVIVENGAVIAPGPRTGLLTVGELTLSDSAKLSIQFGGTLAGSQHDQIIVNNASNDGTVDLGTAQLELTFDTVAEPGTEYVLIRNDGSDAVIGALTANFNTSGATSQISRTLTEGSLVLENFGGSGRPAYITYAGGDGNDVAIVTAGNVNIEAGNVTLIQRRGSNLEIRTGTDLPATLMSTPVIRPIAAINDYQVNVVGSPADQMLFVDLNDFVNTSLAAIQYTGEIFFNGGGNGDNDSITLLDLNPASDDSLDKLRYSTESFNSGNIALTTRQDASQFDVKFAQTESIKQSITTPIIELQYSGFDEQIFVVQDPLSPEYTQITSSTSTGGPLRISIANPTSSLSLEAGDGDDSIFVRSFGNGGNGFVAALSVDGQAGDDSIEITSDLNLGRGSTSGNLDLLAESIDISGNVDTSGGNADGQIDLLGGRSIKITGGARINSGTAMIVVDAAGGRFNSEGGSLLSASLSDAITIRNASLVRLGNMDSLLGRSLIETNVLSGSVSQAMGTRIQTDRLVIDSIGSIDLSNAGNDVRTIENLRSRGPVSLTDSIADLEIVSIDSRGNDVTVDAVGMIELSAGAIVATAATLSLTAGVAITDSRSPTDSQLANLVAGHINLRSGAAGVGETTKPVIIEATDAIKVDTSTFNGNVYLASPTIEMPIGIINARAGIVSLSALSIQDATVDDVGDIISRQLILSAQTGIGSLSKLELLDVTNLSATTVSGGIRLEHSSIQDLMITNLTAGSGAVEIQHSGSELVTIRQIRSGDGNVSITHQDGSIAVVGEGNSPIAISTGFNGVVLITAMGNDSDIILRSGVGSDLGSVRLSADRNLLLDTNGDIGTTAGNVALIADARSGPFGGGITLTDGATITTRQGAVSLVADGDIVLGGITTSNESDVAVFIQSFSGRVVDGGDTDVDISANLGGVIIISNAGIGSIGPLETSIDRLVGRVDGTGSIRINETDRIELRALSTVDGRIMVEAGGTIIATDVESSRDIHLVANGNNRDILVGKITASGGADVFLTAGDDVVDTNPADLDRIIADDLTVEAFNGTADTTAAIRLTTDVNDLQLAVRGRNAGDAIITELNSINLASSDLNDDSEMLVTSNGRIAIEAGVSIVIRDNRSMNDGNSRRDDVELIAGGDRGQVSLTAGQSIELAGATQIEASLSIGGSVLIDAPSVVLGPLLQIYTGNGDGIARWFSLRPQPGLTDTAFFDYTTVATNRLSQSGSNDALGDLSLLIGKQGENGFTMNIDWGDSPDPGYRFQQIDDLPGNQAFVQRHIYREQDILNSTLNGRTSATAPLEVRFSIRHHESIVVRGDTIQQAGALAESVEGRLASSTDNPLTRPLLENGRATFTIPNLTIPLAFVPVREIIPEPVEPEAFVRVETSQFFTSGNVESQTTSASSTNSRDEYFQIRVLSLKPGGKDLVDPQRLPDNILSGENLKKLFDQLPDGRYEIQYVLGNGNERMLLRFDLRNHQPIVPGDALEGNQLELKAIDIESVLHELDDSVNELKLPPPTLDRADSAIEDETNTSNQWSFAGRFSRRHSTPR